MSDQSNRELSSINSDAPEESLTLGGETAKEMGTEYQFVSDIARQVASEGVAQEPDTLEQKADSGREPEFYYDRETPS